MASVHRTDKSKYWHCSYFDSTAGKWRLRSTGSADKAEAQAICLRFESLAGEPNQRGGGVPEEDKGELVEAGLKLIQVANKGELGEATAREFVNRVLKASGQNTLAGETVRSFLDNWLSGKSLSKTTHTAQRYKTPIEFFKTSLGKRADAPLSAVTAHGRVQAKV